MDKENNISQGSRYQRPSLYYQEERANYISLSPSTELTFEFEKNKFVAQLAISNLLIRPVFFKAFVAWKLSLNIISIGQMYPANGELLSREQKILKIVMLPNYEHTERYKDMFLVQIFPSKKEFVVDSVRDSQIEFNRAQNIKLGVRFMLSESQKQIESDQAPLRKIREPLKEKFPMQTPSTDDSMRNKNDVSRLNSMHYIPRRSKLVISPHGHDRDMRKKSTQKNFSKYSRGENTRQRGAKETINEINSSINSDSSQIRLRESVFSEDWQADRSELESDLKMKVLQLEKKYKKQKIILEKIKKERKNYIQEISKIKLRFSNSFHKDAVYTLEKKKSIGFELWHLLLISVAFFILGSLIS